VIGGIGTVLSAYPDTREEKSNAAGFSKGGVGQTARDRKP